MRILTSHKINGCIEALEVVAIDDPGHGGASHHYKIGVPPQLFVEIRFQNGPILEAGVNGITNESLLAIIIDRLEGFQRGPYACHDNACALDKLMAALEFLKGRTRERLNRGVEGTHQV